MFAKLVQATWGDDTGEADNGEADAQVESASKDSSETQEGTTSTTALPSFWGVAASLADTVKKNTAEITAGLKETNWRAELEAFSKGVREEEQVLRHETAKRVEVAKEHLPKDATAQLEQKRKELSVHLQKMGVGLGTLGKRVVTGTTDLFDQVKDALVDELSARDKTKAGAKQAPSKLPKASSKYSRLEADISSMQRDSATYCEEPADSEDYQAWRAGFDLSSYRPAVEALTQENAFMAELQARIVPIIVEYDAFWTRYFYQLHLLEARHAQRVELARRASKPQEEEVAWDDADDQPGNEPEAPSPPQHSPTAEQPSSEHPHQQVEKQHTVDSPTAQPEHQDGAQDKTQSGSASAVADQAAGSDTARHDEGAAAAAEEDAPDAVTNSDSGSATEHWTVVTSPSKHKAASLAQDEESAGAVSTAEQREQPVAALVSPSQAAGPEAAEADDDNDVDDLDDVANDDGPGSEGDEDWGSWE